MNTLRSLFALLFATALTGSVALAETSADGKKATDKPAKAACGCATGKDGKVCGVDKDCCCTGDPAKAKPEDKKADGKKAADQPSAKAGEKAGAECAACTVCKA
jgi:hypothetical protein